MIVCMTEKLFREWKTKFSLFTNDGEVVKYFLNVIIPFTSSILKLIKFVKDKFVLENIDI